MALAKTYSLTIFDAIEAFKSISASKYKQLKLFKQVKDEQLKTFQTGACQGYGYGCGVRMSLTPELAGNLAPRGEFGWDGWKLCIAMADPENRLAVFHAEHLGGFHSIVIPRFRNLIYSCLDY